MNKVIIYIGLLAFFELALFSCSSNTSKDTLSDSSPEIDDIKMEKQAIATDDTLQTSQFKVTFIELGSVRCIPCQQMQPILKSIENKYGEEVSVVFYDVWTEAGSPFATKYGIEAIPTQVFLDENGVEYARHIGFFPEEEVVKVLQQKGVR